MNNKITLSRLISILAEKSGKDSKICEEVLKSFFKQISSALEEGEVVKVKGLGTFKVAMMEARKSVDVTSGNDNEIPAHGKVVFVPAKELAAAVNAPFEMFETIELDEDILEEELISAEAEQNQMLVEEYEQQIILEEEKMDDLKKEHPDIEKIIEAPIPEETPEEIEEDKEEYLEPEEVGDENETTSSPVETSAAIEESAVKEEEPEEAVVNVVPKPIREKNRGSFGHGFIWGMVGALFIFLLGLVALWFVNEDFANWGRGVFARSAAAPKDSVSQDTVQIVAPAEGLTQADADNEEADIAMQENEMSEMEGGVPEMVEDVAPENVVPTKPSDSKVTYDTITTTHYLTTMAKKHYGNYHLWPYIYKENEKILGHPNRIRPGTKIVIPDLKKYGVDPKNPKDIEKAKKLGTEIYDRYK